MTELHETRMGQVLITHTLPELVRQVSRLADAVERLAGPQARAGDQHPQEKANDPEDRDQETQPSNR
jgi:hypothetical protein